MITSFKFLASPIGRLLQSALGSGLILLAMFWVNTTQGAIVGLAGLILLANGVFDICCAAPLFGLPLVGLNLRKELLRRQLRPQAHSNRMFRS